MRTDATALYALTILLALFAITAGFALADPVAPISLTPGTSSSRDLTTLPTQSTDARGGNVTELNINAITVTKSWQGYFGNITGSIVLQDGNNNTFYNWSLVAGQGEVYATRASSITWTGVNCTNTTQRSSEETYLNQTATDGDSVTNTFASSTHPAFAVGGSNITADTCYTTHGYVNNASQSANFVMLLLNAGANIVYTALLNDSATGFNGRAYDFELLVGENEKTTIGITQYYFWVELA